MAEQSNEIVPVDYSGIKDEIIKKLQARGYNADVQGSNANLLAELLAYTAYSINVNTTFSMGEMLITTARYRKNILQNARMFGYEAERKSSYVYEITLYPKLNPAFDVDDKNNKTTYEIPQYTQFTSGSNTYYFMGAGASITLTNEEISLANEANKNDPVNNPKKALKIRIKEGDLKLYKHNLQTQTFTFTADQVFISLPYRDIEVDGTEVYMTYVDTDAGTSYFDELWQKTDTFMIDKDTNLQKRYVERQNIEFGTLDIYFKIASVGNNLLPGTVAKVNCLLSKGSAGKSEDLNFSASLDNFDIALPDDAYIDHRPAIISQGTDDESNESIKENAPIFFNTANRAVTKRDYIAICTRLPIVGKCQVWGGDEEIPQAMGHIWVSVLPSNRKKDYLTSATGMNFTLQEDETVPQGTYNTWYLQNGDIDLMFDYLNKYKIMTMQLHNRHPFYIDADLTVEIAKYPTDKSRQELRNELFNITKGYFETALDGFEKEYFTSNIIKSMDRTLDNNSGISVSSKFTMDIYPSHVETHPMSDNTNATKTDKVIIPLALPYENIVDNAGTPVINDDEIITDPLPRITTPNFVGTETLDVDFSPGTGAGSFTTGIFTYDVNLGNTKIGDYKVVYTKIGRYIYITLDAKALQFSATNPKRTIIIKYLNDNFKVHKNCMVRLKTMTFVDKN